MKKMFLTIIGAVTVGLSLVSCNFANIFKPIISRLSLTDNHIAYVVGQTYIDTAELSIKAKYTNGDEVDVALDEVTYNLTCEGTSYEADQAFTVAGDYSLNVVKDGYRSNTITFKVFSEHQYVQSISVNGKNSIGVGSSTLLTVEVEPALYTVDLIVENDYSSLIEYKKVNNSTFSVKGLAEGEASLRFKALRDADNYKVVNHAITVVPSDKVHIEQTYKTLKDHSAGAFSSCPLSGTVKLLVIPVWLDGSDTYITDETHKENVRQDIETTYFGTSSQTGWHSVSSYYYEESNGTLSLTGTVSEWYEYSDLTISQIGELADSSNIAISATTWYFNNHEDERANYDYDGDGYLDGVILIYACPDSYSLPSLGSNMWAYCYWTNLGSDISNPNVKAFFWASYDFMYDSTTANNRAGSSYGHGDTSVCDLDAHTFIHEMGHVFGLEDYYDYYSVQQGTKTISNTNPAGGFSMQDNNVGGHDAFSLMAMGWADPYIPTESGTIIIFDFQSYHDLILLTPQMNEYASPFDEYLLLELYSPNGLNEFDVQNQYSGGYPQGPNDVGIRVWHVDARLVKYASYSYSFTTDAAPFATGSYVFGAFNNSSHIKDGNNGRTAYAYSVMGGNQKYQTYNILQLIRNSATIDYNTRNNLTGADLFKQGDNFSMSTFNKQFVEGTTLNNGSDLGWSFSVTQIINNGDGTYGAVINLTKTA